MYLMLCNEKVLYFNFDDFIVEVKLNLDKFNKLRKSNKEYDYVFAKVIERCKYLGIIWYVLKGNFLDIRFK